MTIRWPDAKSHQFTTRYALPFALAVVFFHLVWRNAGLYPMVFADEWLYSSAARLLPFDQSILPSYLFLGVFRFTNACGSGFLDCARILNAVLLVASAPFVYLIARQVCSRASANVLALAAVLAPVSSFAAYFMPESMYFLAFCAFAWVALTRTPAAPLAYGLVTGAMLGVMSAIKVHALFLLPAHLAFMLYLCLAQHRHAGWLRRFVIMMAVATVTMIAVRFTVGYAVAGRAGLNLLGAFYGTHATSTTTSLESLLRILPAALVSLKGHMMALALLLPLPLATLLLHVFDRQVRAQATQQQRALQVFALLMLCAAGAMTVMFTASIASAGPVEGVRLHQRYYDFVFPLMLVICAAPLALPAARQSLLLRAAAALPVMAAMLYAARHLVTDYVIGPVDSPELAVLKEFPLLLKLTIGLSVLTLVIWILQRRAGILLFVFVALPITAFNADSAISTLQAQAKVPNDYDNAGMLVRHYLDRQQAGKLTVVGDDLGGLGRALFHIDHPDAQSQAMKAGAPLVREELTPGRNWILVVGEHALPDDIKPEVKTARFALVNVQVEHRPLAKFDFNKPVGGMLERTENLSAQEGWGAWSDGREVRLHFAMPLPQQLNILLRANAFPPRANQQFVLVVGSQRRPFRLADTAQDRFFQFDTSGAEQVVKIEIPDPVSPRALGMGADDRLLGIGLTSIEIGSR